MNIGSGGLFMEAFGHGQGLFISGEEGSKSRW